jgi:hypothetical protein
MIQELTDLRDYSGAKAMLDSTVTPDMAMPMPRYETGTFRRRYFTQVWCVFTRCE